MERGKPLTKKRSSTKELDEWKIWYCDENGKSAVNWVVHRGKPSFDFVSRTLGIPIESIIDVRPAIVKVEPVLNFLGDDDCTPLARENLGYYDLKEHIEDFDKINTMSNIRPKTMKKKLK